MNEFPAFLLLVGATGLEPAASWSRTRRATKLRYAPLQRLHYIRLYFVCQISFAFTIWFNALWSVFRKLPWLIIQPQKFFPKAK